MQTSRRGMTLTELLTVVAVITILLSMMAPVLLRAQKEATRRRCMGNIKELHLGLQLVANSEHGKLPKCFDMNCNQVKEATWWYREVAKVMYPTARFENSNCDPDPPPCLQRGAGV